MKTQSQRIIQLAVVLAVLGLDCIIAHADTVYVWSDDSTIKQFVSNNVGSVLVSNVSGWNGPVGLAVDGEGTLYSGCPGTSTITKYETNGIVSVVGFGVDSVSALAFDFAGNLFATIPNFYEIDKLAYRAGYGYYLGGTYSQSHLSYPTSLALDRAGDIYVANGISPLPYGNSPFTNTIAKFSSDLTYLGDFATGLDRPWGLAFDKTGNLYVSASGENRIYKFTPTGVRSTYAQIGLSDPRGIAFDRAGNLYVANAGNGTIWRFAPNQSTGSAFATGLNSPTSIAIQPGLRLWPTTPLILTSPTTLPDGRFQFSFTDWSVANFSAFSATNLWVPLSNWTALGGVTEISPGQFQFTDPQATNNSQRFYRVRAN
jgi:sugar lactone lactonase YvrE